MMNKILDLRGLQCPEPVIQTKKVLEEAEEDSVTAVVDNSVASENIQKLLKNQGYQFNIYSRNNDYYIDIHKDSTAVKEMNLAENGPETVVLVMSNLFGSGDEELGAILMKSYLYALKETTPLPSCIIFLNGGVKIPAGDGEMVNYLKEMEGKGVEIMSCGTCLDFFHLKEHLKVGSITNIYTVVDKINTAGKVVRI